MVEDTHTCTHLDLAPAIACSDIELSSLLRHIDQGPLCRTVRLSAQSMEGLVASHLSGNSITASVSSPQNTESVGNQHQGNIFTTLKNRLRAFRSL